MTQSASGFGVRRGIISFLATGLAVLHGALFPAGANTNRVDSPAVPVSEVDYVVDFWRTEQGLPNNTVNALLQTRDGYLWVGTAAGLARFDGLVFTLIGDEIVPGLKDARITALLEDREGRLWAGTQDRGVVRIGGGEARIFSRTEGLLDNAVTSLAVDTEGRVWIGTHRGLNRWTDNRLEAFESEMLQPGEPIATLHAGRSGTLWISTRFEVYRHSGRRVEPFRFEEMPQGRNVDFVGVYEDRAGNLWAYGATFLLNLSQGKRINYFRSLDPASSRVWTICEQEGGGLWIGTSGRGLFRFRDGRFDVAGSRDGLDQCDVRALHADHEGNLWVGTSGSGLARLQTQRWRIFGAGEGLNSTRLTALTFDGRGQLIIGTADAGLNVLNHQRAEPFPASAPLAYASHIRALCLDGEKALWIGTWGAGLFRAADRRQWHFTTAEGLSDNVVLALAAEPKGNAVWAGTLSGGLHRVSLTNVFSLTTADGLTGRPIVSLLTASDGSLLIGFEQGGLARRDDGQVQPIPAPPGLRNHTVSCLREDQAGRLWAGTIGGGAFCRVGESWIPVGMRQGLVSDVITQIIQDEAGHYWFNSDKGLSRVYGKDMEDLLGGSEVAIPTILSRLEDRPANSRDAPGWARALRKNDGTLWFVANGSLLTVDPRHARVATPPRVMIERVLVDGEPILSSTLADERESLRLGPGVRSMDFAFTAVSFTAPQKTRFRHKLEGFDLDWVQSDTARRAHYGPVPPGKYRFHVIAVNADGIWNDVGDALSLVVVPPVWQAWWFLTLSGLAGVGVVWLIVRLVTFRRLRAQLRLSEQQRAMERERTRIAQDMHDEIGSKLTRISFLSEAARNGGGEPAGVGPQVEAIANTSRELLQALDEIVWAVNPRNDNLEHLAGYLEQYAREYFHGTPVDCAITLPDQFPGVSMNAELRHNVFLAFEEALSNALQHARAQLIRIEMGLNNGGFEIAVRDDGRGMVNRNTGPGHDGLQNMKERLRSVGGACVITSESGKGTTVRLRFPIHGASKARQSSAATL